MHKSKKTLQLASRALILIGATFLLAACAGPSIFAPVANNSRSIYELTIVIFGIAALVFVLVEGWLIYTAIRYRGSVAEGYPRQIEGNTRLEIAWTALPLIFLLIIFAFAVRTLYSISYLPNTNTQPNTAPVSAGGAADPNVLHVRVIGHQWWWEFDYPDLNIVTGNEMHVPAGMQVAVDVESADVIHSFWVPQVAGKMDAVPGHVNHIYFKADQTGDFLGQCAEYCGTEHAWMRLRIIVDDPGTFDAWVKDQQAGIPQNLTGAAAQGEQVFLNGPCIGCHTINGTKAQGKIGPNLTHFASRTSFAGSSLENTPDNVTKWLQDPQAIKPGNLMPNLHLSQEQISQLVAFLESLK
jgi:cytochrome c oxidase subunit 2